MNTVTLDGAKLKAIAHKSHTATVTATSLALRERLRHSSDITRTRSELARQGERIVEADYMQFWKDLQAAGVGSIVYGRKGKPDRFDWHYSLKEVAKACIDGSDVKAFKTSHAAPAKEEPKAKTVLRKATAKEEPKAKAELDAGRLVFIPLRADFNVEIKVPADFSKSEAEILASALSRAAI